MGYLASIYPQPSAHVLPSNATTVKVGLACTWRPRSGSCSPNGGFAGKLVDWAACVLKTTMHVARKPQGQKGLAVIPRRWVVERTLAWITAHRRLAHDYERDPEVSEALICWAGSSEANQQPANHAGPGPTRSNDTYLKTRS